MESLTSIDGETPARAAFSSPLLEQLLVEQLKLSPAVPLRVAYSGGLDSHVLLLE